MNGMSKTLQGMLGVAFLAAGSQKLAATDRMVDDFARYRYPPWSRLATGTIEVAGGVGLLGGLARPVLVPAAGLMLGATMLGALVTHARLHDPPRQLAPAAGLLVFTMLVTATGARRRMPSGRDPGGPDEAAAAAREPFGSGAGRR